MTSTPGEPSKTRTVHVWWKLTDDEEWVMPFHSYVNLTEGYSSEEDIPRILAIRFLSGVDDAERVVIHTIEEVEK